jgi:hypothetical protein
LSNIRAATISDAAGTGPISLTGQKTVKAYLNYNQDTNSIIKSFNVSSVTDDSGGEFTPSWTASFDDAIYIICGHTGKEDPTSTTAYWTFPMGTIATGSAGLWSGYSSGTSSGLGRVDCSLNFVSIIGDLA